MTYHRYLFREIFKISFLFLFSFFFIYITIDYSTHASDFTLNQKIDPFRFFSYYGCHFIKRLELLLPLSLLIATLRVLLAMNQHGELTALQASGIRLTHILRPFLTVGILATLLHYSVSESILPKALNYLDLFENEHFGKSKEDKKAPPFQVIYLTDGSKLFYQKEDRKKNLYFDVLWVRSSDDLFRMKYLSSDLLHPTAYFVDHLTRDQNGAMTKKESFEACTLTPFSIQKIPGIKGVISLENKKMSALCSLLRHPSSRYSSSEVLTHLLLKLLTPLLSILAVLAPIPFCIRHSRNLSVFVIYGAFLFGFITFFTCLDGAVILGENHTISPFLALLPPFLGLASWIGWKFKNEVL